MALSDYIEALSEDKREAYKSEIAKAIFITSKEEAQKLVDSNDFLKAANQADRDRRYAEMEKKYQDEKLPKLLEEERKKGQKQPWEIEIDKLRTENEAAKRETAIEKQRARALIKAQELGVPVNLIDKFVGLTDEETDNGLKILAETLLPWRQDAVTNELEKFGSQRTPSGGAKPTNPADLRGQYDKAISDGNADLALALQSKMQETTIKRG